MTKLRFSKRTREKLRCYVYCLRDPQNNEIFYVGKAVNERALSHLKVSSEPRSEKERRIADIRKRGLEPEVDILRYGLDEVSAFEVEAAIIDALGLENLTNEVRGKATERGLIKAHALVSRYNVDAFNLENIKEPLMFFFLKDVSPTLSDQELYDRVRGFWQGVSQTNRTPGEDGRLRYDKAMAIADGVVIRAYSILGWFRAGETFSTRVPSISRGHLKSQRYEFVGNQIDHRLVGRRLLKNGKALEGNQKGYGYHN